MNLLELMTIFSAMKFFWYVLANIGYAYLHLPAISDSLIFKSKWPIERWYFIDVIYSIHSKCFKSTSKRNPNNHDIGIHHTQIMSIPGILKTKCGHASTSKCPPSTEFELTPLTHCRTNRLALYIAPYTTRPHLL